MKNRRKRNKKLLSGVLLLAAVILLVVIVLRVLNMKEGEKRKGGDEKSSSAAAAWTVTQWGSWEDSAQSMFYTIEDGNGNLTLIDGGYEKDTNKVRDIIKEKGGHIQNWILTHPHPDHIQVFNSIYGDLQGIKIDHIYAPQVNYEVYKEKAKPWDDFPTFERFYELAENMPQLSYLEEGDELDIMGLKMTIYNACNEEIEEKDEDIGNDCGLAFKLSGERESMLFLADLGKDRENHLLDVYGNSLKADYVQMGHHGNSSLSDELYKTIAAKAAFFDAPQFLMEGTEERFTTPHYRELMESLGAVVKSFETAPNKIELH